ncbi:MAG TPA: tRNA uridine-5-carboxymethylaminomethyl(34) synthesis enzyme MnmG [bacterium]|nr:tRNA uridine-5-carboxymethylaminomethyl(34) synthesis enzyme MnmG [bacterium]
MFEYPDEFDVIVVGAGHAGCEAALAVARMGRTALLLAMDLDRVAHMSCNPAVGGLAKGHLVKEIDALGGEMGRAADRTGIQFRRLNASKGPAVRGTRCQSDKLRYRLSMRQTLETTPNLKLRQGTVEDLVVEDGRARGVITKEGVRYRGAAVVITTGTFLRGLIHVGMNNFEGGRVGDGSAKGLSATLARLGFELGRLKTGTPARLDGRTIDFARLEKQPGDAPLPTFSFDGIAPPLPQVPCWLTWTNESTHRILRDNLDRSPMFSGKIVGTGPRYCPSIEDKVVRFAEKERHQIFLEPEGLPFDDAGLAAARADSWTPASEVYCNGLSTSMPVDVQLAFLRTIAGLERCEMMRPGYAVEYDFVPPTQLFPSLETRRVAGLFHAGQINGTSGYEEAAGQGLVAGINAARFVAGEAPVVFRRDEAYLGVMVDDLVTRGTSEPYRMFTSRAEHRLLLREDNADERLRERGYELNLVDEARAARHREKWSAVDALETHLKSTRVTPSASAPLLREHGSAETGAGLTLEELLRRPEIDHRRLAVLDSRLRDAAERTPEIAEQVEIRVKYAGYLSREREAAERARRFDDLEIPRDFVFRGLAGLSAEATQKLESLKPATVGQAGRISGITPAAISVLLVHLRRRGASPTGAASR